MSLEWDDVMRAASTAEAGRSADPRGSAVPKPSEPAYKRFVRQEVAADRWDVSVDTVRRLISEGRVTGYRLNGRVIRVDLAEVDACFRPIETGRQAG